MFVGLLMWPKVNEWHRTISDQSIQENYTGKNAKYNSCIFHQDVVKAM